MEQTECVEARKEGWVGQVGKLLSSIATFLELRVSDDKMHRIEAEVRTLVEPSLPLLMHKRRKFFAATDIEAPEERWHNELTFYVDHILWPMLGVGADRNSRLRTRVIGLIDAMVIARQQSAGEIAFQPRPATWSAGWAG